MERREFVTKFAALNTTLPTWMPRMAFAAPPREVAGDVLVCVFLRGGADALNVVVPYGEDAYYKARPQLAIRTPGAGAGRTVNLDGFFGLHPTLLPLKDIYTQTDLAFIHAVGNPYETRSHFDAMDYMERGTAGEKMVDTGWLARHLQSSPASNQSPFRAVGMGPILPSALRGPVPAVAMQSIADFHLKGNTEYLGEIQAILSGLYTLEDNLLAEEGAGLFDAFELLAKANPAQYQPRQGVSYPDSDFGKGLTQIAQLIKADIGLEVACIDLGGWDTHILQGGAEGWMASLLADYAAGLAAFYADLPDQMNRITVVTMSEFGRRVAENAGAGTDHGRGGFMSVMGGQINGGQVFGAWVGLHPDVLEGPGDLPVTTDFRTVLGELLSQRMGNPNLEQVFPNYNAVDFLGVTS